MSGQQFLDQRASQMLVRAPDDWERWLEPEDTAKVREASTFREQVKQSFLQTEEESGLTLPFEKATAFRFRPGELTIWTGYNGHKKSMVMGNVGLGLIAQGATLFVKSLEMKPYRSIRRLVRQYVGVEQPTIPYQDRFFDWVKEKLWFYDYVGTGNHRKIVAMARYAATEIGTNQIFIDSLMKCGIGEEDYESQKWFVDALQAVAKDTDAHVHLVAHSRKPSDGKETIPPTKYQIHGSSKISDLADNVLIVHTNESDKYDYDMILNCDKQREGESEPKYLLFFDEASLQHKPFSAASKMTPEDWELCRWR